ncbi:molybdopterin-binding protein [Aquabacterium sp. CECT 9606]|uniref:competence/damage-inducible protein A n=1 Tax=Aquabacterium sp. CECT 9606 TaxID=2845822 RepID=UPI001E2AC507|nr:molybdopterin-binding protein [Aquabacterium sp. CECT 9606]CAH0355157.1 CinA-like protein [Aquabacterium sp. CECT 9606]
MIGIIIIGDEILSGRREDKHLVKAIELLKERGLRLSWARYVGDEPEHITAELRHALSGSDVVFSFGGIGATPDDHTRACAGAAWGRDLTLHPEARELILARSKAMAEKEGTPFLPDHPDTLRRLDMGRFPQGATIIPNPYNQIPGFSIESRVHFLPGFPVMAWPMMAWVLDELHADLHGQSQQVEHSVIVYAMAESVLTPMMVELEQRFAGVRVFSLPSVDHPVHGRHIELGVKGMAPEVGQAFEWMRAALVQIGASCGPIMVR